MSLLLFITIVLLVFFTIGANVLTAFNASLLNLGKFQTKEILNSASFLFKNFYLKSWEKFYTFLSVTKHLLYLLYAITFFFFFITLFPNLEIHSAWFIILFAALVLIVFLILDFFMRFFAKKSSKTTLKLTAFLSSLNLLIFLPLTWFILFLAKMTFKKQNGYIIKGFVSKEKVLAMINDSELSTVLTQYDQNIIASVITLKEKVAREIMIPRVDIFAIDSNTSIKEASKYLLSEDYSRIPVYEETLDNIIGVLMYKDLLKIYTKLEENKNILNEKISTIVKPAIYCPENKKVSKLFQEFKNEKIHLAIIVNEYGGTEGIITIEDILEELVGEIKDEYDVGEERQFWRLPSGDIVVDAKMTIIDLEEKLNIKIPHSVEYETIGGFIFHKAGTIPTKGWKMHLDDFDMEVLISNERCIEKIKIILNK
ncbi:MAG: HlyC/CorC family transporter [Parachlamydiales bacterium]|nr:HlyC/CorC family transporter [Parachlamydiales bacterium]